MANAPETPHRETLVGSVERVTFHNEDSGFAVLKVKARGQRDLVPVVGHAASISAGEFIHAVGVWFTDRTHGLQFKADSSRPRRRRRPRGSRNTSAPAWCAASARSSPSGSSRVFGEATFEIIEAEPREAEGGVRASASFARRKSPPAGPSRRPSATSWSSCIPMASEPRARCASSRPMAMTPSR